MTDAKIVRGRLMEMEDDLKEDIVQVLEDKKIPVTEDTVNAMFYGMMLQIANEVEGHSTGGLTLVETMNNNIDFFESHGGKALGNNRTEF